MTPLAADGTAGPRRLAGLTVRPDRAPRVRVTTPGRDLLLPDGNQTVTLALDAEDDLGLATLALRYTRIGGSGENFTFTDGEVALDITRASDRAWTARATWTLAPLALGPGDMVIYRGVATDRRPNTTPAESDTFILEVTSPGSLPSDGFAIDDRENRYAISQQMVILRTERLTASRPTMAEDEYRREAQGIAAEQRQVRAEFVFMMGGELADAKRWALVGYSFGARAALLVAARRPDLRAVVSLAGGIGSSQSRRTRRASSGAATPKSKRPLT